jgi:SM-20-related protein
VPVRDNLLPGDGRQRVYDFIEGRDWESGWKSNRKKDIYSFFHQHYAGHRRADHSKGVVPYDCAEELSKGAPLLFEFWRLLSSGLLRGHTLIRCYANGFTYGCDGTIHTDSKAANSFTSIYYPHEQWSPNWGGETVFFNKEESDIIGCTFPKPNRLLTFRGDIPHVGRGVSRQCPVMRITLMFKTRVDGSPSVRGLPAQAVQGNQALGAGLLSTPQGDARFAEGLGQQFPGLFGGAIPQHLWHEGVQNCGTAPLQAPTITGTYWGGGGEPGV